MKRFPRPYWYLFLGVLINRLGAFVFPFLALYLTQERHMTVSDAGVIVGLYGAGSFASGPVGGALADRFGRRATLLGAFVASSGAMLQLSVARSFANIAVSTLFLGFFSDLYRPALQASVADLVPPEQRTRAYGYLYWAVNLGTAGAASLGGFLASANFSLLFLADAATTLAFGFVVFFGIPETRRSTDSLTAERASVLAPYRDRIFMLFVGAQFLVTIVFAQVVAALPIDMRAQGISAAEYGLLISINGLLVCALQPLLIHRVQQYPRAYVLSFGSILTGAGMGTLAVAHSAGAFALTIVLWTFGELAFSPVAPTVVADLAPNALRASYQGTFQMSWGAAWLFAPSLGTLILERFGREVLWLGCLAVALIAAVMHLTIAPSRRQHLAALDDGNGAVDREDGVANAL